MPAALAIAPAGPVRRLAGGSPSVSATTRSTTAGGKRRHAGRPGLVAQQPVDALAP